MLTNVGTLLTKGCWVVNAEEIVAEVRIGEDVWVVFDYDYLNMAEDACLKLFIWWIIFDILGVFSAHIASVDPFEALEPVIEHMF